MELTLNELQDKLSKLEETYLLELLDIESIDLVERFVDIIEMNFGRLCSELEEEPNVRTLGEEEEDR